MRSVFIFLLFTFPLFASISEEQTLIAMVNQVRIQHGRPALKHWPELSTMARTHSQNMATRRVPPGHAGFEKRAAALSRIKDFGENVAYSYNVEDHLQTALTGWLKSPPHRENLLGPFQETGIGIAFSEDGRCYITQLFATRFSRN